MSKVIVKERDIPVDIIRSSPYQPRLLFNLNDIKESIMRDGILVSPTVRKKDGFYELIDGERRWRIARELGHETITCNVIDVDDETARRMVWKVNTLRKDYEPKEKALFFKRMKEELWMSFQRIATEYDISPRDVKAYLNVFKLPEKYQQMVWDRDIPIRNIRELDQLFNRIARAIPEENPGIFELLDRSAMEKHFGAEQIREAIKPYLARLRKEQIQKAKEALTEFKPEIKTPETPEEFERAAMTLRREARRKREELLTLEEKARIQAERETRKHRMEEDRKRRMEAERGRIEAEATKRARELVEGERRRIEKEAMVKARQELVKDPEFLRRVAETASQKRTLADWRGKEIPAKGPEKEIVTEDLWECPICHVRHRLIHLEPRGHKLEKIGG